MVSDSKVSLCLTQFSTFFIDIATGLLTILFSRQIMAYLDTNALVWLTQKAIAQLFDVDRSVVTKHLKNIFIPWLPLLQWDIGRTLPGQRSFASGRQIIYLRMKCRN